MRRTGGAARLVLALVAAAGLVLGSTPLAAADPEGVRTYPGPAYSAQVARPPTFEENQSKLWFYADAWWALMLEPTGRVVRVYELMPDHTWRPTSAVVNPDAFDTGDAVLDGDGVHVVTRRADGGLYYVRLTFDPVTRDYLAAPGVLVTTRGIRAPATVAEDSTGRLWVAHDSTNGLWVVYSDDDGRTWSQSNALAVVAPQSNSESAALVAYDDRVGLLWSSPGTGTYEFASHRDGDLPTTWTRELAHPGPRVGDQTSLRRVDGEAGDTLVAAIQTSPGDLGEPADTVLIEVLVRTPDGRWTTTPVSTVADGLDQPVLQVDVATRTLYLYASTDDDIVVKQASLDDIRFPPGPGSVFLVGDRGRMFAPTVGEEPVDSRSGRVVLASDHGTLTYRHAEAPIVPPTPVVDPNDTTPPEVPSALQGRAESSDTVVLSWNESIDGTRWVPARTGVPVREYVVLRDGVEIATVTSPFLRDQPRTEAHGNRPLTIRYEVVAVDDAGNRSASVDVIVDLPRVAPEQDSTLLGVGLLSLAALVAGLALFRRRRLTRASGLPKQPPAASRRRDEVTVGGRSGPSSH